MMENHYRLISEVDVEITDRQFPNHRGSLSIDVSGAWYFITICAEGHRAWVATKWMGDDGDGARSARGADPTERGRAVAPRPPSGVLGIVECEVAA